MSRNRRLLLPLFAALALAVLGAGISACGYTNNSNHSDEGEPLTLGQLKYNVTFSRYLNPSDTEDSAYLVGQPEPPKGSTYFGVFFEIQNESDGPQTLPDTLTITDEEDNEYEVIESESVYGVPFGSEVPAEEQIPVLDSPAQQGPIEGAVAIFLLPEEVSGNRPLTLHIPSANGDEAGDVTLDR
jgi:hypothetical protein